MNHSTFLPITFDAALFMQPGGKGAEIKQLNACHPKSALAPCVQQLRSKKDPSNPFEDFVVHTF